MAGNNLPGAVVSEGLGFGLFGKLRIQSGCFRGGRCGIWQTGCQFQAFGSWPDVKVKRLTRGFSCMVYL